MSESDITEKVERRVGQRGVDNEPREFNPKSLLNLKQFQEPESSVDSSVNLGVNWIKIGIILVSTIIAAFAIWKIWNKKKMNS